MCFHRCSWVPHLEYPGRRVCHVYMGNGNYFKKLTNVINEELKSLISKLLTFSSRGMPKVKSNVSFSPHVIDAVVIHKSASMNCEHVTRCMNLRAFEHSDFASSRIFFCMSETL